jgi:DNA-binding IclR family transcriptional regulator
MTAITKALTILRLAGSDGPVGISTFMNGTGLPRSTVMRIVGELLTQGFLERADRGRYRPGPAVRELAFCSAGDSAVTDRARAELKNLVLVTAETAHYAVYDEGWSLYVDKVDGLHPVRAYTQIGGRSPAYATATGKALLAWQSQSEVERVAQTAQRFNRYTHASVEEIRKDVRTTRAKGYAVNRGEWREGVWGIAAPVFAPGGRAIAAFGLSGPESRIRPRLKEYAAAVLKHAQRISASPLVVANKARSA